MSLLELPAMLETFDYTRVGEHGALLRVLTRLSPELGKPAEVQLHVSRSDRLWQSFPARGCRTEADLHSGGDVVWRGLFAVPLALVQQPQFGFELAGPTLPTLALPRPALRGALTVVAADGTGPPELAVTGPPELAVTESTQLRADQIASLTGGRLRTRAVALATALAVTATSTPALALADGGLISASHAAVTQHRIQRLADFAAQRARAEAARKQQRTSSGQSSASRSRRAQRHRGALAAPVRAPGTSTRPTSGKRHLTKAASGPSSAAQCLPANSGQAANAAPGGKGNAGQQLGSLAPASAQARCAAPAPTQTPALKPTTTTSPAPTQTTAAPPTQTAPTTTTTTAPTTTAAPTTTTSAAPTTTTSAAPTTTTTTSAAPTTTSPAASGGAAVGTTGASGPTGATTPAPTPSLSPTPPPVLTGKHAQPTTHKQLPITIPSHGSGGSSVAGSAKRNSGAGNGGSGLTLVPTAPGFLGPKSWTGTVTTSTALTGALGSLADQLANGNKPPRFLIPIYMEAGRRYHVPWQVLAAINSVESDFGRNLNTSSAGAIGWMQFEPSTWKQYGLAVDGHSVPNPYDPRDAIFSAARYLAAAGAAQDVSRAIFAYNHATWYVNMVLTRARAIAAGVHPHTRTSKHGVVSAYFASWHGHLRARYKGGVLSHYDRLIATANMVSAANFPYVYAGGHEQPARFEPFDCSGSVSYVIQQAGYRVPTTASGGIPIWKFPAGPGRVTIFYNAGHTFMRIGNRYFGTSGFARPGGGAGWFDTNTIPASYLAGFHEVHVPRLGSDSFAPSPRRKHAGSAKHGAHATPAKHGTHTAQTKHPRYLQQFAPSGPRRASFASVLQLRFPSA